MLNGKGNKPHESTMVEDSARLWYAADTHDVAC